MTDFNSNPEPLKATTDGDTGSGTHDQGHDHAEGGAHGMGGTAGVDLSAIREDMEVVGSDGGHVGSIDHFRDGQLKLKRQDPAAVDGQHHFVPAQWVSQVDAGSNRVMLNLSRAEATSRWTPAG
jgi:hypothetical protein